MAEYILRKLPTLGRQVIVPQEYDQIGKEVLAEIHDSRQKSEEFNYNIVSFPFLTNPGIFARAASLFYERDEQRQALLQDALYLRIMIWGNEKNMGSADRVTRMAAGKSFSSLIPLVRELEERLHL